MRSVVGGALRVTPSCTVHFISTVGFSAFQPLKSLPLKSWIGLPSFHDPSSLSAMTGARTPVHGVGAVVAPSLPNVPSSLPPVRRACHTGFAGCLPLRPAGGWKENVSSPSLMEIVSILLRSPEYALTNQPEGLAVPAPVSSSQKARGRGWVWAVMSQRPLKSWSAEKAGETASSKRANE